MRTPSPLHSFLSYLQRVNFISSTGAFFFFLSLALIVPLVLGWFHLAAQHNGILDNTVLMAIVVVMLMGILMLSLWMLAQALTTSNAARHKVEDDLRQSVEEHKRLIENSVSAIASHEMIFGSDGKPCDYIFLSVNPAFESQTGISCVDLIGKRVTEVLPGIDKTPFMSIYGSVVTTGKSVTFEHFSEPLRRHFCVSAYSLGGNRFATVFNDVTEKRKAEMALEQREAFLKQLLETIPAPVFYKNTQGQYLGVNKAFEEFFGISKDGVVGKTAFDIAPRELACIYNAKDQELYEKKCVQVYNFQSESKNLGRRDTIFYKASLTNEKDEVTGLIGVILDITERKRAEEALKKNEAFLSLLLNTVPMPVFSKDCEGRYIKVNKAFETLFWKKAEDILGKTVRDLQDGEQAIKSQEEDALLIAEGGSGARAYFSQVIDGLGLVHEVIIQKAALFDDFGDVAGIVGSILDITDIKRTEDELREAQRQLDRTSESVGGKPRRARAAKA